MNLTVPVTDEQNLRRRWLSPADFRTNLPPMLKNSIVGMTGQTWKLAVATVAMLAGSILPAFPAAGMSWTVGTVIAVAGYAFGLALIRCPECKARWFWDALMRPEIYKAVLTEKHCPECNPDIAAASPQD